ncbi:MAG: type II secretion system protein [Synergistales bacterium]|nr:type II secretion system protein [Synergistales bacterium]MDY6402075.1 type II secretion system protein [Synergistales bacterium]MDY6405264.1 type II secretion system protein [Synergistales bacterium]MDY6410798.1 type II secretion system protein [Synergistales bacterium]MDY6413851.1 type II secretion system protein [Synergistales bacterium]
MKNAKLEMKRRGFTLVELLIVIVVIGVLSAMMMLSSTEAVSSAKAADIVSDLRNLKTAALAWYADNLDYVEGRTTDTFTNLNAERTKIFKYMNNENIDSKYSFAGDKDPNTWFVWYDNTSTGGNDKNVGAKLYSRAKSTGLYKQGTDEKHSADIGANDVTVKVGMFIR